MVDLSKTGGFSEQEYSCCFGHSTLCHTFTLSEAHSMLPSNAKDGNNAFHGDSSPKAKTVLSKSLNFQKRGDKILAGIGFQSGSDFRFCHCFKDILHSWIFLTFESCVKMLLILVMAMFHLICIADC